MNGQWIDRRSRVITGTQDWTRVGVSVPVKSTVNDIYVKLILEGTTGTAYFDTIQVEQSELGNAFNMIENGDFTYDLAGWNAENSGPSDGILIDYESHPLRLDTKVLNIFGDPLNNKKFNQTIPQSGKAGDVYVLGGWARGDSVYNNGKSVYKLTLEFVKTSTSSDFFNVDFNKDTTDWQFASSVFVAPNDYTDIKVHMVYHYNGNPVKFDGIHLYKGNQASYVYNSNGSVTNVTQSGNNGETVYSYNESEPHNPSTVKDEGGSLTKYDYDSKHNLLSETTTKKDSQVDEIRYENAPPDSAGNILSTKIFNVSASGITINNSSTYDEKMNYLSTTTDPSGNTTQYNYNTTNGVLNYIIDPKGNKTIYEYDALDRLEVVKSEQRPGVQNRYGYTGDELTSITHNGFDYIFDYDKLGNLTNISAAGQNLITNVYNTRLGLLTSSTYGNNQQTEYKYDAGGRLIEEASNGVPQFTYTYDAKSNMAQVGDQRNNQFTKYVYDYTGKLVNFYTNTGWDSYFAYDNVGNVTRKEENHNNKQYITQYQYGDSNRLEKVLFGNSSISYNYIEPEHPEYEGITFSLGRLNSSSIEVNGASVFNTVISYHDGNIQKSTTNRIKKITNGSDSIDYTYDANGNIETITQGAIVITYQYDSLNQLDYETHENIESGTKIKTKTADYIYDDAGNIKTKVITTYGDSVQTETISYGYDSIWKDKLTSFNGKTITSDSIGNPLSYDGWNFTWERGRQLAALTNTSEGKALSFTYNENGIRTSKTVNGVKTSYHLVGDAVTHEQTGDEIIYYTYDPNDKLISMNLGGTEYYYVRNAQNDIIGLVDGSGNYVAHYTYDSWGNPISIKDNAGNDVTNNINHVGYKNPYRYRGYRYDNETRLYYLQSRYYNPEWGRFINADGMIGFTGELLSHNMFAYCLNNPVNAYDPNGDVAWWIIGGAIGAIIGGVAGAVISYKKNGKVDWRYVAGGAAAFALIGAGAGALAQAVYTGMIGAGAAAVGGGALAKLSQSTINFAVSNMSRLQHAFKHAKDLGFGNWNSNTAQQWKCFITGNLQNYTKVFQNTLGNDSVTGYYRYVNGMHVATYIYNSGQNQGLIATVVKLSAQQLKKFGL